MPPGGAENAFDFEHEAPSTFLFLKKSIKKHNRLRGADSALWESRLCKREVTGVGDLEVEAVVWDDSGMDAAADEG